MSIDKLEPFTGDAYQSRQDLKFSNIYFRKKTLFMDERMIICDTHIWTEIDLESYVRNYYVHRQDRAVFRWRVPIQTRFQIFKYLIKERNLFMDDRMIICDTHIWTEIDLESYVRNYYVHRQVRAVLRWRVPIQTRFEIFKYLIKAKKTTLWMTGWIYVIPTYEQKLIWIHM